MWTANHPHCSPERKTKWCRDWSETDVRLLPPLLCRCTEVRGLVTVTDGTKGLVAWSALSRTTSRDPTTSGSLTWTDRRSSSTRRSTTSSSTSHPDRTSTPLRGTTLRSVSTLPTRGRPTFSGRRLSRSYWRENSEGRRGRQTKNSNNKATEQVFRHPSP